MATKVRLKKSAIAGRIPGSATLDYGELAINYVDGRLWYKNSSNAIKSFADSDRVQASISTAISSSSTANNVNVTANNSTDETVYLTFVDGATGTQGIETDTSLTYNPNSNLLIVDANTAGAGSDTVSIRNSGITSTGHTTGLRLQYNAAVPAAIRAVNTNISNGAGRLGLFTSPDGVVGNLAERLSITSAGLVGIGTSSPDIPIQLNDYGGLDGNANQLILSNNTYYSSNDKAIKSGFSTRIDLTNQDGSIRFLNTAASSNADANITFAERMRIDNNGDVQIGTDTSSGAKLTLFGSDAATTFQSSITGTGAGNGFTTGNNGAVNAFLWNYENGYMQFATNNTERMRIDSSGSLTVSGNVGINKSPNSAVSLSVKANTTATNSYGLEVTNSSQNTRFLVDGVGSSFFYKTDNAVGMKFDASSGNLLVSKTTTSVATTGVVISSGQGVRSTVDGNVPLLLNRLTDDGNLIDMRKDGTVCGSLKSSGGDGLVIEGGAGSGSGLVFGNGSVIFPARNGSAVDNLLDIGRSTSSAKRFKDLHLSGSAYTPVVQGFGDEAGLTFGGALVAPRKNNAAADGTVDLGASSARFKDFHLSGGVVLDEAYNTTVTATTTSTSQAAIASFSATTYGSAEVVVTAKDGTARHITKFLIVHTGSAASHTEYGTVQTGSSLATFDVDINGGNVRVLATPASTNSTVFNVVMTLIDA
tara:strand:+ start:35411 stop:37522 length:2112 start_codon:yes stop_codon:yes gene_type:complete